MEAYAPGGFSLVETADLPSAHLATDAVQMSGIGDFSYTDLQRALTGKVVSAYPSINAYSHSMEGSSCIKDFETLLQLNYLHFTAVRKDEDAFKTLLSFLDQQLTNKEKNPKAIWRDSITMMASNYSDRTVLINRENMEKLNYDRSLQIFQQLFSNPRNFTFTFTGNIDPNDKQTRALIEKWIGGMKTKKDTDTWKDRGVRAPLGENKNYFTRDMQTKTASNRIQYTSYDFPYTMENVIVADLVGRILSTRYLESIREREGGSYGVGCAAWMNSKPVPTTILVMQFDTDPEKQDKLMQIIHQEVQEIIANGPLASDLQKEKESMLKDFKEDLEKNGWWYNTALPNYYRLGINMIEDYEKTVQAVDGEKIQQFLKKLAASGNVFEVVMLPE